MKEDVVEAGDVVITAGWRSGRLASAYPRGIPIGIVTGVGQLDTDIYKRIEVDPFVDFVARLRARARREAADLAEAEPPMIDGLEIGVIVFVAAVLQASVFSSASILGGAPDILLVALVAVALDRGATTGAVAGFFGGLVIDIALLDTLGVTSLLSRSPATGPAATARPLLHGAATPRTWQSA